MITTPTWVDRASWPFAPRAFSHDDGQMHYIDEGDGPLVVLVHGTPTWSFEWRHLIRSLVPQFRVLAVDHLGFGLSERPARARYAPEDHAQRFQRWLSHVAGDAPYSLVVHDFGGPIALPALFACPERCQRLIVTNSWAWDMGRDPALRRQIALVQGALGRWLYRYANASQRLLMPKAFGNRAALTPQLHAQYLAPFTNRDARERVLYRLAQSLHDSASFFDGLYRRLDILRHVPVDLIWGMRDGTLPVSILAQWEAALPHAGVHRFVDSGHWPHEEEPERFASLVRQLLEGDSSA